MDEQGRLVVSELRIYTENKTEQSRDNVILFTCGIFRGEALVSTVYTEAAGCGMGVETGR